MIISGAEYALYWLAVTRPHVIEEALRFQVGMLANNRTAEKQVKDLMEQHENLAR